MTTDYDVEMMAKNCTMHPRMCGERGSVVKRMTPLCLKEWVKGNCYHPFCYKEV